MSSRSAENQTKESESEGKNLSRRDFLKVAGAFGALATVPIIAPINNLVNASSPANPVNASSPPTPAGSIGSGPGNENPYGGGPGTGISLPPYYQPTPSVVNANTYFPGTEKLGPDEMRISFMGSSPWPPRQTQAATCIMVELGNGKRFFFDFGPGCLRNIIGMGIAPMLVNDIFLSHLHVDHYGELPYLYAFAPWAGRWTPLRVTGPSGRTAEDGTSAMITAMKQMARWHTKAFNSTPIGDGYEVQVNEFDYTDDNGICYNQDGVTVRHWRRSHSYDGASAFRLDWNGLSFVWTGDGRPDERTIQYAKGVDVFVTELVGDLVKVQARKQGISELVGSYTIDVAHTPHYAGGYMMKQINPRIGMVTHFEYDEELIGEIIAGVRTHWGGIFQFGAPDGVVVNVTKDAIWNRKAALPEAAGSPKPDINEVLQGRPLSSLVIPQPRFTLQQLVDPSTLKGEVDPKKYYPPDVYRQPVQQWPKDVSPSTFFGISNQSSAALTPKQNSTSTNSSR